MHEGTMRSLPEPRTRAAGRRRLPSVAFLPGAGATPPAAASATRQGELSTAVLEAAATGDAGFLILLAEQAERMNARRIRPGTPIAVAAAILLATTAALAAAQVSQNMSLFGTLDPEPIHYAGCWGYTSPAGSEYALIGAFTGTSIIAIDDSTNIHEVAFIPGPDSNWREYTVIGDHAYVVSEGSGPGAGMQVIDLGSLPLGAALVTTYTASFTTGHIIQRDTYSDSTYVYVMGTGTTGGVHIMDVSDPANPIEVGTYAPYYIHDAHVRGDRMYASAIYDGWMEVVDISDKTAPTRITRFTYPIPWTHSSWTNQDNTHLIITDEINGRPARIWSIEDLGDIHPVAEYTGNDQAIVHNPYGLGDFVFFSHNTEGIAVVDIADPTLPVEVGYYDTWPGPSGGFHGLWSAYPYFPSGKIIGGNRGDGLWVWRFNGTRAGRLYGTVTDSIGGGPIAAALIAFVETGNSTQSGGDGSYGLGDLPSGPGGYTITASAAGYLTRTFVDFVLDEGTTVLDIALVPETAAVGDERSVVRAFRVLENRPNPFNPRTAIRYELAAPGEVELTVHDAQGRTVATLIRERQGAGRYEVEWDGRDEAGAAVASGIYLYRLRAGSQVETRKMTLVK